MCIAKIKKKKKKKKFHIVSAQILRGQFDEFGQVYTSV